MLEDRVAAKKKLAFYLAGAFGISWVMELI